MSPETKARLWGVLIGLLVAIAAMELIPLVFSLIGSRGREFAPGGAR